MSNKSINFASSNEKAFPIPERKIRQGAVLEWLKRHAWKACIPQKGIPSSNLGRSAKVKTNCNPAS